VLVWRDVHPALLAAVTVMMVLPNTKRLMFGYLSAPT